MWQFRSGRARVRSQFFRNLSSLEHPMYSKRQPYIRPFVLRLEYVTDVKVSQTCACKTEGASSGAGPGTECTLVDNVTPCSSCDS